MNDIYKQLTNIDIEEQKKLWDERGKGYYGEFLVFCELYKNIQGTCKILMNLNIPTINEKATEIDLVLIHETGVYIFEIKHYKGTIYGDEKNNIWTQYFRTTKNNTFKNPILQNNYHINALKNILHEIPLKSIIVFTNQSCNIKVTNHNSNITICKINNLIKILEQTFQNSQIKYSIEEIDSIFNTLSKYSQMQEPIIYNGKEESFISWLQPALQSIDEEKSKIIKQLHQNKKIMIGKIICNITVAIICIVVMIIYISSIKFNYNDKLKATEENYNSKLQTIEDNYNIELEKFKQNFKHVDEIDNEYITALNEYFSVSDISLNTSSNNSVTFTAKISTNNDVYGMALTENSKYIVMLSNGKVYEYDVFGSHLNYNKYYNMIGKGIRDFGNLAQIQFFETTKDEISYIKITDIELFKLDASRTLIKKDLELELYSK